MNSIGYINTSLEIFGALLSFVIIVYMLLSEQQKIKLNQLYMRILVINIILLLSDAIAIISKGHPGALSYWTVRIANFCVFSFGYVLYACFTQYLAAFIGDKGRINPHLVKIVWAVCIICIFLVVISQFNGMFYYIDEHNIYHRGELFWLSQVIGLGGLLTNAFLILRHRKNMQRYDFLTFLSYIILPVIAVCIQIFVYGLALLNIASSLCMLVIYASLQSNQAKRMREQELIIKEAELALKQKELELAQGRIHIMLSQIKPHFLFNSLSAIGQLCDQDPAQAKEAILDFSDYLRANLDSLTQSTTIPFQTELEHIKTYLALEQRRFSGRLQVVFDIEEDLFFIPSLTVQPIVENAVRHGILKRPNGGTLTIKAKNGGDHWLIEIKDDGAGFDISSKPETTRSHIGIENVRSRLQNMCGGSLEIQSTPGVGTHVCIRIPKAGENPS